MYSIFKFLFLSLILFSLSKTIFCEELKEKLHQQVSRDHLPLDYKEARFELFNNVYLETNHSGVFFIFDTYCEKVVRVNYNHNSFSGGKKLNIEHSWPQSKFNKQYKKELQKADLHHLFLVHPKVNGIRGNYPFAEVESFSPIKSCKSSLVGLLDSAYSSEVRSSADYFEPPAAHKGNVARALFYFSIRYNIEIQPVQEYFLRKWHVEDPVTEMDIMRNELIMKVQGNRNPFIDDPTLVEKISNF